VATIAELRRTIQKRTSNVYDTVFTRRVSIYVTAALAPTGITANQVSVIAALVGGAACALIAFGTPPLQIAGALLIHLHLVLDSVDGELARLRKSFTLRGLFIEDHTAYTMINAVFLAVAWYLRRGGHGDWPVVAAVALAAFGRNAMPVARRVILNLVAAGRPPRVAASEPRPPGGLRHFIEEQLLYSTNIWVVLSVLIIVEAATGRRAGVALVYAYAVGGWLLKEAAIVAHLVRGETLERQLADVRAQAAAADRASRTPAPS
jgi:phosphatidylglycerophosphate synthase